jgi:DNA-binding XRE family transcriptional regulator
MKNLTQIAKDRRKKLRLSQKELAKMLGVRQATISDMETGKTDRSSLALYIIESLGGSISVSWQDIE